MRPGRAANQLTAVWRSICQDNPVYPVNCRKLAEALGATVVDAPLGDEFEAQLNIRGSVKAIIINENIREIGRQNFCISHELGHLSCHAGREEFSCSSDDLNDMAPHPQNIEQEANLFAATLLMPADDFREQTTAGPASLRQLGELASQRYQTSLTATCRRLIDLSPRTPYGMAVVKGGRVKYWGRTDEMKWTGFGFKRDHVLSLSRTICDGETREVPSTDWLTEKNAPKWTISQSAIDMPYYGQTLFLIKADRNSDFASDDEVLDPTPRKVPSF